MRTNLYSYKDYIITCILCNLLMLTVPLWLTVYFDAHDDALMLLFASGAYTGHTETHLIYNHIFYGSFLAQLYTWNNQIEWYTLIQHLIQIISFNVFLYNIWLLKTVVLKKILYSVVLMSIAIMLLIRPQYTFIASEVSLASIVLIFNIRNKKRYILSFILFFIACNLRITGALIPYIIIGPLMVFPIDFKSQKYSYRIIFFLLLIITAGSLYIIDKKVYNSDPKWKAFMAYNTQRQYIVDNPAKKKFLPLITDKDKQTEYNLIVNHGIFEGTILTTADLTEASNYTKKHILDNIRFNLYLYGRDYKQAGLIIVCIILMCLALMKPQKRDWIYLLCLSAFVIANLYCMSRSTSKIYLSMALTIPLLFVLLVNVYNKRIDKWNISITALIIILGFTSYRIYFTNEWNNRSIQEREPVRYLLTHNDAPKVSFLNIGMGGENAFHISKSIQGRKIFRLAWATNSPHNAHYYKNFTSYINGMPLLITDKDIEAINEIIKLIKQHYKIDVTSRTLDKYGQFSLIQLYHNSDTNFTFK